MKEKSNLIDLKLMIMSTFRIYENCKNGDNINIYTMWQLFEDIEEENWDACIKILKEFKLKEKAEC